MELYYLLDAHSCADNRDTKEINTTASGGSLGSLVEEERS